MKSFHETILIIDDDETVLSSLKELMEREGFHVFTSKNGEEGEKILKQYSVQIILADQKLPGLTGIDIFQKAQVICPEAIRILISAFIDEKISLDAITIGRVHHFITKPWDNGTLVQIIKLCIEKYWREKDFKKINQELLVAQQSLVKFSELGVKIQETMLFGNVPHNIPGIEIKVGTLPAKEFDGDFYEFWHPNAHVFDLVIGDAIGKGMTTAVVSTAIKTEISKFALPFHHPFIYDQKSSWHDENLPLEMILKNVDKELSQKLIKLEYNSTLFYIRFDLNKRKIYYIDCGFTKPIHYHKKTKTVTFLKGNNYPLGTTLNEQYTVVSSSIEEGDLFFLYTDGLTDVFELDKLSEFILQKGEEDPETIKTFIMNQLRKQKNHNAPENDSSIVLIKIESFKNTYMEESGQVKFYANLAQLNHVREYVERVCAKIPGNKEAFIFKLKLAINELFCNIVKHGYRDNSEGPVIIQIDFEEKGIKLELKDQGEAFNPSLVNDPSFFGDREDGYGWYIIRQIADQVIYLPKKTMDGWNHIWLFKKYQFDESFMDISYQKIKNVLVITPKGESLDAKEAPEFKEKVLTLLNNEDIKNVVFNLNGLKFVDSSGLGSFLSILRRLNTEHGDLKLAAMTPPVRNMFELVSMHKIFDIYPTIEEAIKTVE